MIKDVYVRMDDGTVYTANSRQVTRFDVEMSTWEEARFTIEMYGMQQLTSPNIEINDLLSFEEFKNMLGEQENEGNRMDIS